MCGFRFRKSRLQFWFLRGSMLKWQNKDLQKSIPACDWRNGKIWKKFQNQQILKSTFSELWKSAKDLQQSKVCLFKKNGWISIRAARYVYCLNLIPRLSSSAVALKTNSVAVITAVKTSHLEATGWDKIGLECPKTSRELSLFDLSGSC